MQRARPSTSSARCSAQGAGRSARTLDIPRPEPRAWRSIGRRADRDCTEGTDASLLFGTRDRPPSRSRSSSRSNTGSSSIARTFTSDTSPPTVRNDRVGHVRRSRSRSSFDSATPIMATRSVRWVLEASSSSIESSDRSSSNRSRFRRRPPSASMHRSLYSNESSRHVHTRSLRSSWNR